MGEPGKTIVISGYYGFKNSGDEAVLQSILLALQAEGKKAGVRIDPVVLSADPAWTERTYGVRAAHRMRPLDVLRALAGCDGLISGGGSLLQDATGSLTIPYYLGIIRLAQWLGKPVFVYAQGVGPVNRAAFFKAIGRTFRKCRYVSVRDEESAELLAQMGCARETVEVVPDPVLGLPPADGSETAVGGSGDPAADGERPVVGVSVRFWNEDRSELAAVARSLRRIAAARPVTIRFLPFHLPADEEASRAVIGHMGVRQPAFGETVAMDESAVEIVAAEHPQQMLAQVRACDLLVGMRLHSLIYAATQRVPMVGISYDPKIDRFLRQLDLQAAASTERFDESTVVAEAVRLLAQKRQWMAEYGERIERLKEEATRPAQQIAEFFRRK